MLQASFQQILISTIKTLVKAIEKIPVDDIQTSEQKKLTIDLKSTNLPFGFLSFLSYLCEQVITYLHEENIVELTITNKAKKIIIQTIYPTENTIAFFKNLKSILNKEKHYFGEDVTTSFFYIVTRIVNYRTQLNHVVFSEVLELDKQFARQLKTKQLPITLTEYEIDQVLRQKGFKFAFEMFNVLTAYYKNIDVIWHNMYKQKLDYIQTKYKPRLYKLENLSLQLVKFSLPLYVIHFALESEREQESKTNSYQLALLLSSILYNYHTDIQKLALYYINKNYKEWLKQFFELDHNNRISEISRIIKNNLPAHMHVALYEITKIIEKLEDAESITVMPVLSQKTIDIIGKQYATVLLLESMVE